MKFANKVGKSCKNSIKMKEEEKIKPHRKVTAIYYDECYRRLG